MADEPAIDATNSLIAHSRGDSKAVDQLTPLLYGELRRIAGNQMRQERPEHTLYCSERLAEFLTLDSKVHEK